jgi:hypothetical protein
MTEQLLKPIVTKNGRKTHFQFEKLWHSEVCIWRGASGLANKRPMTNDRFFSNAPSDWMG